MTETLNPTGAKRDPIDHRDIQFSSLVSTTMAVLLPRKYSLRNDIWFKAFRQKYGSCVGSAGRYIMQFFLFKWSQLKNELSERFIYGRAKEMDGQPDEEGTWPRIALMGVFGSGAPKLARWPQSPSPTHADFIKRPPEDVSEEAIENILPGGCVRVTNYEELKRAIYLYGPVMVSLAVYQTYDLVGSNGHIKPSDGTGNRGNHENIAIGWDDDTGEIELMNSWGEGWGDDGFAFMPLNYDPTRNFPLFDMWAVTEQVNAQLTSGAPISLGYPVETKTPFVTQAFGARPEYYAKYGMKGHNGIDFRTRDIPGKYIIAADDGEIISCNPSDGGYGMAVRIKHSWGISIYGHNSQFLVTALTGGDATKVKRGQRIAIAGATGDTGTPPAEHCHFGIRINGVKNPGFLDWVDPSPYFKELSMTKFFRVQQGNTLGVMIVEAFSGSVIMEDKWGDYQDLLKTMGMTMQSPLINLPNGQTKFRIDDHGKAGILLLGDSAGPIVFENDWTEYQVLLKTQDMTMDNPLVVIP